MRFILIAIIAACIPCAANAGGADVMENCLDHHSGKGHPTMTEKMICYNESLTSYWQNTRTHYMDLVQKLEDKNLRAGIAYDHHKISGDEFIDLIQQAQDDFDAAFDRRLDAEERETEESLMQQYQMQSVAPIMVPQPAPPTTSMTTCTQYGNTVNCMGTAH